MMKNYNRGQVGNFVDGCNTSEIEEQLVSSAILVYLSRIFGISIKFAKVADDSEITELQITDKIDPRGNYLLAPFGSSGKKIGEKKYMNWLASQKDYWSNI